MPQEQPAEWAKQRSVLARPHWAARVGPLGWPIGFILADDHPFIAAPLLSVGSLTTGYGLFATLQAARRARK